MRTILAFFLAILAASVQAQGIPINCPDSGGNHLNYTTATHAWSCGTSPGGGVTIGGTVTGGTAGRVLFEGAGPVLADDSGLVWDATNNRLGIGVAVPNNGLQVNNLINFDNVFGNIALGPNALISYTTGFVNTGIGYDALKSVTTGNLNLAIGYQSQDTANGNSNTTIGTGTLRSNTGSFNVAIGSGSLANNSSGSGNTGIGSVLGNSSGSNNVAVGYNTAIDSYSGSHSIIIGQGIEFASSSASNQLNIGNIIFGTGVSGTNQTIAGNIGIGTNNPANTLSFPSGGVIGWETSNGVNDTSLSRVSAGIIGAGTGAAGSVAGTYAATNYKIASTLAIGGTAPTLASGGCTSPSAVTANGTARFSVNVGTSCTGSQPLVFTLPAATTGWNCYAQNSVNAATIQPAQSSAISTTSVTITAYSRTLGTAVAWNDNDVVVVSCLGG